MVCRILWFPTRPHEFAKSINFRRFDVSQNSCRARNDIKKARNDIKKARNDIRMSPDDNKKAPPVDFRARVAPSVESITLDVNYYASRIYGKKPRNQSAKADQKLAF